MIFNNFNKNLKISLMLLFTILIALSFSGASTAWEWTAHKKIVDEVYTNLPSDVQKNLKPHLDYMKDASTNPDVSDTVDNKINHRYPGSYSKANYWLDRGKASYDRKDYHDAAWSFGMASHYISDTFAAPHCDWINDKDYYWQVGNELTPKKYNFQFTNLNTMLKNGKEKGKESVAKWNNHEDRSIVQQDLNRATSATYASILYHAHPSVLQ